MQPSPTCRSYELSQPNVLKQGFPGSVRAILSVRCRRCACLHNSANENSTTGASSHDRTSPSTLSSLLTYPYHYHLLCGTVTDGRYAHGFILKNEFRAFYIYGPASLTVEAFSILGTLDPCIDFIDTTIQCHFSLSIMFLCTGAVVVEDHLISGVNPSQILTNIDKYECSRSELARGRASSSLPWDNLLQTATSATDEAEQ